MKSLPLVLQVVTDAPDAAWIEQSLHVAGFEILTLGVEAAAKKQGQGCKPALILLNLHRFDAPILQQWGNRKETWAGAPVLALVRPTHAADLSSQESAALDWGIDAYLHKPISERRLLLRLATLLRRSLPSS